MNSVFRNTRRITRLVEAVWHLGPTIGWRYWKMQNKAIAEPELALSWADNCIEGAEHCEKHGEPMMAWCLRDFAEKLQTGYRIWRAEHPVTNEPCKCP